MKQQRIQVIAIGVGVVLIAGIFLLFRFDQENNAALLGVGLWETTSDYAIGVTTPETDDAVAVSNNDEVRINDNGAPSISAESGNREVYSNTQYGFSFSYPSGYNITSFQEGELGDTVLIQGADSSEISSDGMQLFISPFDEDMEVVTPARIRMDLPNLLIEESKEVVLHDGKRALIFFSYEPSFGRTREVWMVHNGSLYQITSPVAFDTELSQIMGSWRF